MDDGTTPNGWETARHDQTLLALLACDRGLKIHWLDNAQEIPIDLGVNESLAEPFHMTWTPFQMSEKRTVYLRSALYQYQEHVDAIHYY